MDFRKCMSKEKKNRVKHVRQMKPIKLNYYTLTHVSSISLHLVFIQGVSFVIHMAK